MKKTIKFLIGVLIGTMLSCLVYIMTFWFNNPELTSMQVVIKNWIVYVILFGSAIGINVIIYLQYLSGTLPKELNK